MKTTMATNEDEVDCQNGSSSQLATTVSGLHQPQADMHTLATMDLSVLHAELLRRSQIATPTIASALFPIKSESAQARRSEPYVEIVEEPRSRGLRFRYKCEGRSAGSLPGEHSTNEQKTFPTIRIVNFSGPAAIVVVSCVTKDKPYCPHPHNLVGQDCRDGVCTVKVKGRNSVSFPNIGIQCCKRHDVEESLKTREKIRVDPFGTGYYRNVSNIDLNSVRLCFQVFLPDANKKFTHIVQPVVSQPIIDKKSIHDLVICRLSRQSGYAGGGDEVFLLCEKINKDDIQVRFFEETEDGIAWEAFGDFASHDVHRQYAIVFRTPPYRDPSIQNPVQVFIQLRRPSDDETGDPKPFQYIPQDLDPYGITNKRKRKEVNVESFYSDRIPLSVLHEVKGESEAATSGDVKSRLKKKAVSGLQRKDKVASAESAMTASATESSAAAQLLVNAMSPSVSNTAAVRQITPSTPIVLSAEALTSLLMMNTMSPQQQQTVQSQPTTPSVDLNAQLLQLVAEQAAAQTMTLSMDSVNVPSVTELGGSGTALEPMSNDLEVGAQEMVSEEGTAAQKQQHPLHLN